MANNQYNRKTAARGDDISESNPLDELARIVGYDPRQFQADSRPEPQIDLEAELLRELHGLDEPAALTPEAASHAEGFADPATSEEAHPLSEEMMMTTSLEDELLRELQADHDAEHGDEPQDQQTAAANGSDAFGYHDSTIAPETPESAQVTEEQSVPPETAAADGPADAEASLDAAQPAGFAEPEPDEGGFSFPSMDELEDDPGFAGGEWAVDDQPLDSDPQSLGSNWPDRAAGATDASPDDDVQANEAATAAGSEDEETRQPATGLDAGEWWDESAPESLPAGVIATEDLEVAAALEDRHPDAGEDALGVPPPEQGGGTGSDMLPGDELQEHDSVPEATAADRNPPDDLSRPASSDDVLAEMDRFGESAPDFSDDGERATPHDQTPADPDAADQPRDPVADSGSSLDEWLQEATADPDDRVGDIAVAEPETTPTFDADTPETGAERESVPEATEVAPPADADADSVSMHVGDGPAPGALQETAELDQEPSRIAAPVVPIWLHREAPVMSTGDEVSPTTATDEHAEREAVAIANPVMPEPNVDERLAFDASALAEHDEAVESTPALDIPRLPEEEMIAAAPLDDAFDFEAGVESDFMELLGSNGADGNPQATGGPEPEAADTAGVPAAFALSDTGGQATAHFEEADTAAIDYDDLEQALEASLAAPAAAAVTMEASRPAEQPAAVHGSGRRRTARIGVAAAGVVLLAAVGLFVWDAGGPQQAGSAGPRIIAADKTPVKQKPAHPGGKTVPNQNKIVYDRVDGADSTAPAQKELLTTTEKPVDIVQQTLQAESPDNAGAALPDVASKSQARLSPEPQIEAEAPASTLPRGVEPHFVRTMTVTADGKLVPAAKHDTNAGGAEPAGLPQKQASPAAAPAQETSAPAQAAAPAQETAPESPAPQAITQPQVAAAPLPTLRPDLPTTPAPAAPAEATASSSQQTVAAAPATSTQPPVEAAASDDTQSAPANPGGYFIQISSQPTEAGAKASYQNLAKRYASVIGGHGFEIQRADISGKGIYYRVRIPAGNYDEASSLCDKYKAAGGACFVTH